MQPCNLNLFPTPHFIFVPGVQTNTVSRNGRRVTISATAIITTLTAAAAATFAVTSVPGMSNVSRLVKTSTGTLRAAGCPRDLTPVAPYS
jgi:hypothetical protein